MLTLTSPVDTVFHKIPAGAKLAALCVTTVGLFWLSGPIALLAALGMVAGLTAVGGRVFAAHALRMLRPLWLFVLVIAVWHLWIGAPREGAEIVVRMVAAVAAANLVTMTTRLTDMIAVVERLAAPLARVGLNPRTLALAIALVIRFIPTLAARSTTIAEAFRARSMRRPGWRVVLPALLSALDDAEHVADALRARGGAK